MEMPITLTINEFEPLIFLILCNTRNLYLIICHFMLPNPYPKVQRWRRCEKNVPREGGKEEVWRNTASTLCPQGFHNILD